MLMTIASLGDEWKDPSKIPVKEIIEEWRAQASRNRYEGPIWYQSGRLRHSRRLRPSRRPLPPPHAPPPAPAEPAYYQLD